MKIAEFVAEIALKGGKESISTMKGLMTSTIATKAALLAAVAALYKFTEAAREQALMMDMFQVNTGLSSEQLQTLGFKAAQAGVSVRELGGTIQRLQQLQTDFLLGKGGNSAFQLLGLDARKDPIAQLDEIGKKLRYLHAENAALAKNMASQLGLSDSMYYSIITGATEEIDRQLIVTQEEQKSLVKLNQEWNKFWFYLKQIALKLQAMSAPLQGVLVRAITHIAKTVLSIYQWIDKMTKQSKAFKNTLIAIGLVVLAVAAYFQPWLAAFAAIALIIDDIIGYFNGEDSVTGAIVNWAKQSETAQNYLNGIKTLFEIILALGKVAKFIFDPFLDTLDIIRTILREIVGLTKDFLKTPLGQKALEAAKRSAATAVNPFGSAIEGVGTMRKVYEENVKPAITAGRDYIVNVTQNNNVSVEAGENPEQAGRDFQRGMNDMAANEAAFQLATP